LRFAEKLRRASQRESTFAHGGVHCFA
jgi:hypothetical protein